MKKIISTLVVFVLLFSAIGLAFNIRPDAMGVGTWHLDVFTGPAVVNTYIPGGILGTGDYPSNWQGPITAPLVVNDTSVQNKTQYWFDHWELNTTTQGGSWNAPINTVTVGPYSAGDYLNATAVYLIVHKLTIITPWETPVVEPGHIDFWYWHNGIAHAGLTAGSHWVMYGVNWIFDKWTGAASGSNFASSNAILMDGPKTAEALWYVQYYLEWNSTLERPGPGLGPLPYGAQWFNGSLYVPLSAPLLDGAGVGWHYIFDHWDQDGTFYPGGKDISVLVNAPHYMMAHYIGQDYLTFNDDTGGDLSHASTLSGWYNWSTTYTFAPPVAAPIPIPPANSGMRWRWAYWTEDNVFLNSSETMMYHVTGPHTLTAHYHMQYKVQLDTDPSALPTPTVVIQGSTVSGPPPISGWFDSGASITFWAPDVAVFVDGKYQWVFDTSYYGWWYNGGPWTNGNPANTSGWRSATYVFLNTPLNVTAKYKEYFYVEWDTLPLSNMALGLKGNNWYAKGSLVQMNYNPSIAPNWVFKQIWDSAGDASAVSQGIGVNPVNLDGGSLNIWHSVKGEYWNVTTMYIAPFTTPKTAPAACTYFDVYVYAANFLAERQKDLKAIDFHIYYNSTLIKLAAVEWEPELNALWGRLPSGGANWFVVKNESFSAYGWDYHWFAATAINGAADFQGSKAVVKLTFHIIVDPCYPTVYTTPIGISAAYPPQVTNSTGNLIMTPELIYPPAQYSISAPQPVVKMVPGAVTISTNSPQSFFDVFVKIELGIHIEDFYIVIDYPSTLIDPVNVTFGDYLAGPIFIQRGFVFVKTQPIGKIYVYAAEDLSSPLGNGNGTLFSVKFRVINQVFWNNPALTGSIGFNKPLSYLSCICDLVGYKTQPFNPVVASIDCAYKYDPMPGDLNFDGYVDISDLILLAHAYNPGVPITAGYPYDLNLDGYVDIIDLVLVANHWHPHP